MAQDMFQSTPRSVTCFFQVLTIKLEESECFSSWVMSNSTRLETCTADIKCEWRLGLFCTYTVLPPM